MRKVPREVAGFVSLPVTLSNDILPKSRHFVYLKLHEPQIPDEDASRSMFMVNIPISTTESHLRYLFANRLGSGRVEKVEFANDGMTRSSALMTTTKASKKRKRQTMDELETALEKYHLPSTFPSDVHVSGSTAIVTFVDRPSLKNSLKAARHAAKTALEIIWESGTATNAQAVAAGLSRYEDHNTLQFPPRATLLRIVDKYMTAWSTLESSRFAENARKRAVPDEDGFVTVTRGSKSGALKKEEADELKAKQTAKQNGLEDFYRFQMREKRKEQAGEFLRKFEDDKKRVAEMRRRRGVLKPES